jgi:hypothetical protein
MRKEELGWTRKDRDLTSVHVGETQREGVCSNSDLWRGEKGGLNNGIF